MAGNFRNTDLTKMKKKHVFAVPPGSWKTSNGLYAKSWLRLVQDKTIPFETKIAH
jgi:hypothetical protein